MRRTIKARRGGALGETGEEVARWERSDLNINWRDGGYLYHVTIATPAQDDQVQCSVGKSPLSESFLELLSDPARDQPAS